MVSRYGRARKPALFALLGVALLLSSFQLNPDNRIANLSGALSRGELSASGRLVPTRWVTLSFPTGGRVTELSVAEGDWVSSGAPLARLGDPRKTQADVAAAELELLLARQARTDLDRNARQALALAEVRLAEAQQVQEDADWKAQRMEAPIVPLRIEQAHANLLLAQQALDRARRDLEDAQKLWDNRRSFVWWFAPRGKFKLQIDLLERKVALAARKVYDAREKYADLQKPVDAIDLQLARADAAFAAAFLQRALRDRDALLNGPDPDEVALADARLEAAMLSLQTALAAAADAQLIAPFDGQVVSLSAKEGQWLQRGQPVLILADRSGWTVEINDLPEADVPFVQAGQPVKISLDALPDQPFSGRVVSVGLYSNEEDGEVTYLVKISMPGGGPRLRWGMTARVRFFGP